MCRSGSPGCSRCSGSICKRTRGSSGSTGVARLPTAPTRLVCASAPSGHRRPSSHAFTPGGRQTSAARSRDRPQPGGAGGAAPAWAQAASATAIRRRRTPRKVSGLVLLEIPEELAPLDPPVAEQHRLVLAPALGTGERLHLDRL